ncbi:hypothetical protein JRO89_XS01G0227300 [Xanthoceras sorbifolium]|uniref:RING-type E3 ubiquitin transferase n=1 Tax=Xanthoceras sorbifolium TaxID=99658 RepID=A0ABQ8IKN4_9ROSI|nr:hypothetical protein JRO89_XS01G0227300 [Xanthoceras sorbifolium]
MVSEEEAKARPQDQKQQSAVAENDPNGDSLFSPRFKSVAAMAGWDEEAILVAALVVEDTPDRLCKHKKRSDLQFKTPPSHSRRKRRAQRRSPVSIPVVVLDLDEEQNTKGGKSFHVLFCKKCLRSAADKCGKRCPKCRQLISNGRSCTVNTVLWNTIQLLFPQDVEARKAAGALNNPEEHRSPARGSHYNVRTRSSRPSLASSSETSTRRRGMLSQDENGDHQISGRGSQTVQSRSVRPSPLVSHSDGTMRRRGRPNQDEDAALALRLERENLARLLSRDGTARRWRSTSNEDEDSVLALRLQREEFMDAFRETHEQSRTSLSLARANLRAMASRAINVRTRRHPI